MRINKYVKGLFLVTTVMVPVAANSSFATGYILGRIHKTCYQEEHKISELQNKIANCSKDASKDKYLIIQSNHNAIIDKNTLTLYGIQPYVTAFTQRPVRKVELITLDKFLRLWDSRNPDSFTNNPPNAAINALLDDNGEHTNFFVQLFDPVYNASKGTLSYKVKVLDNSPVPLPEKAVLQHFNLFIDDICLDCWWPK